MLVCHEVGEPGALGIADDALEGLCRGIAANPRVWVAPVAEVAERISARVTARVPPR